MQKILTTKQKLINDLYFNLFAINFAGQTFCDIAKNVVDVSNKFLFEASENSSFSEVFDVYQKQKNINKFMKKMAFSQAKEDCLIYRSDAKGDYISNLQVCINLAKDIFGYTYLMSNDFSKLQNDVTKHNYLEFATSHNNLENSFLKIKMYKKTLNECLKIQAKQIKKLDEMPLYQIKICTQKTNKMMQSLEKNIVNNPIEIIEEL